MRVTYQVRQDGEKAAMNVERFTFNRESGELILTDYNGQTFTVKDSGRLEVIHEERQGKGDLEVSPLLNATDGRTGARDAQGQHQGNAQAQGGQNQGNQGQQSNPGDGQGNQNQSASTGHMTGVAAPQMATQGQRQQ